MKLDDDFDFDDKKTYKSNSSLAYTAVMSLITILCITLMVVFINKDKISNKNTNVSENVVSINSYNYYTVGNIDDVITGSELTAADLDFWDDYQEEGSNAPTVSASLNSALDPSTQTTDVSEDGLHTCITYDDGTTEWIDINPYLALNNYNYSNLVYVNSIMKYYDNQVNVSFAGVDLSKNDDYVDFTKMKNAGIDYCMLKLGTRGFSTGDLILDENFFDNYNRSTSAGLDVGLYFFSQAVSKEEAVEEAQYVLDTISENNLEIQYPIVFYMESLNNNDSRTAGLTQMQRTNIAIAFMDTIKEAGYVPMIYGNKEYLLKKVSFGSLVGYDVWVGEEGNVPDFPYNFTMWRYTSLGKIDGIAGFAHLNICFTDYSLQ